MLVIRLKRIGKKSKPTYRVVVAEHSVAVNGSFVSDVGFYNPHTKHFSINKDEVTDWMNKGAKPSNTVARLLQKEKIKHKSIVVIKFNKAPKKKKAEEAPKPVVETAVESNAQTQDAPVATTEVETETNEQPAEESSAEVSAQEPAANSAESTDESLAAEPADKPAA